jgi:hypothetical protein
MRLGVTGQGPGYTGYALSRGPLWESGQSPRRISIRRFVARLKQRARPLKKRPPHSNKVALAHSEAFGHCLDAIVRSGQQLFPDREDFGDHGGEACVDFSLGAILNDEVLPLAGASQLRLGSAAQLRHTPQLPIQSQEEEKVMGELEGKAQFFLSAVEKASTGLTPFAGHTKQAHFSP